MKKGYLDIEKLTNEGWMLFRNIHTQNSIASEMRKLEYFAAPDVVEVVRCKDCQWVGIKDYLYVYCRRNGLDGIIKPDDYCSRGERKEGEE